MKPTPFLDFWQKPPGAGDPVALIATTFALEPDFFEQDCLARFLEVSSVSESTGSIDDIVASVELHELLQSVTVTVLADRSAPVERTSLLWDLLTCCVPRDGLLHSKVALLMWENATRVLLGSANLTRAGYRRQIELGLAADLGSSCLLSRPTLIAIADEIESYLDLVPRASDEPMAFGRAAGILELFRTRAAGQPASRHSVKVAFAPTNDRRGPLDQMQAVWRGAQPLRATHVSAYWDDGDDTALAAVRSRLSGRPASFRSQEVGVVLDRRGRTPFPESLTGAVDSVRLLTPPDDELRSMHAKCLLVESDEWVAALVGSSNHTRSGLGLGSRRHREINVWLGAARTSKEGKALQALIQLDGTVPTDAEQVAPSDEDEETPPGLPPCFGICQIARERSEAPWQLRLELIRDRDMPAEWQVILGDRELLTGAEWRRGGRPETVRITLDERVLPTYLVVVWDGYRAPWAVTADDRRVLPLGAELASLRARQLLAALASGRPLSDVVREELTRRDGSDGGEKDLDLDPLKRFELPGSLLKRGRALAVSLSGMQRRLERPALTLDMLRARLAGPLGPEFLATKIAQDHEAHEISRAGALFAIAEITLSVGRVKWRTVVEHLDLQDAYAMVEDTFSALDDLCQHVGSEPADLAGYAERASKEARRCLSC